MLFKNYTIVMIMKSRDKNIKHCYSSATQLQSGYTLKFA